MARSFTNHPHDTPMRALLGSAVALVLSAGASVAQPAIIVGSGWEAFPSVEYKGGDARFPKKAYGMLVLTDSTVAFHGCKFEGCYPNKRDSIPFTQPAIFSVELHRLVNVEAASRIRAPSAGSKIMFGVLANDRAEEMVALTYETETSAEAPVFVVRQTQSAAIDAKVRFRLKKLGKALPTALAPDSTGAPKR